MQNDENNDEGARREEIKKNKTVIFNNKKGLARGHSFMVSANSLKFGPHTLSASIHKYPILVRAQPFLGHYPPPRRVILEFSSETLTMRST